MSNDITHRNFFEENKMNTHLEIERKFLLKRKPKAPSVKRLDMEQYYTPNGRYRHTVDWSNGPLRSDKPQHTYVREVKKRISPGVYEESDPEYLTEAQYLEAIKSATKSIAKTRFIMMDGDNKWEIDCYKGILLVTAELEVKTEEELKTSSIPDFIKDVLILEVTGNSAYSNFNLADTI